MKRFIYILAGAAMVFSCKPNIEAPKPESAANLDFSKYVAVGDYFTAGFYNGGLNRESQQNAYPAILSKQFALVNGPVEFTQPYFNGPGTEMFTATSANGSLVINGSAEFTRLISGSCNGISSQYEHYTEKPAENLQNLGMPALKMMQIRRTNVGNYTVGQSAPGNLNYNPYFERILPANDSRTYLQVVAASKPSYFTCWLGLGDVINFALAGGSCGRLPTTTQFTNELVATLDTLTNRKTPTGLAQRSGAILNLPSIKDFAFVKAVKSLELQNKLRTEKNDNGLTIWVNKQISPGSPTYAVSAITDNDVILPAGLATLNTLTTVGGQTSLHGLSQDNPLTKEEVLDEAEINNIEQVTGNYNNVIENLLKGTATKTSVYNGKVIYVDMKDLFGKLRNGVNYNGVKYSNTPVSGGIFSYDNFSLTPRGQALLANKIIQTMNMAVDLKAPTFTGFGTNIPEVNVNEFQGLKLP